MASNDEDYYNTLIDWLREPESVERFLKACVKAYAVDKDQLQSLIGCAEEALQYLNGIDLTNWVPHPFDHFWPNQAHAMGYEIFESVKDSVQESLCLLYEYKEMD
jgi:hypothetical protein